MTSWTNEILTEAAINGAPVRLDYSLMTRCRRGHDLTVPDAVYTDDRGKRCCIVCRRNRDRLAKQRVAKKPDRSNKWFDGYRWRDLRCKYGHDTSTPDKRDARNKCLECRAIKNREYREKEVQRLANNPGKRAKTGGRFGAVLAQIEALNYQILQIADRIDFASAAERVELRRIEAALVRRKDRLESGQ